MPHGIGCLLFAILNFRASHARALLSTALALATVCLSVISHLSFGIWHLPVVVVGVWVWVWVVLVLVRVRIEWRKSRG